MAVDVEIGGAGSRTLCLPLDSLREADADIAVGQHGLDHVRGHAGIAELSHHPRPASALAQLHEGHPPGHSLPAPAAELHPAPSLEDQLSYQESPPLGDQDDAPLGPRTCGSRCQSFCESTWRACSLPSSGLVLELSFALTCGAIPVPLIDVPSRVRYSPTVRSSAPPLLRGMTSWKVPLPKEVVPTTVAMPDCSRAAVTISDADAVSPLINTTIGWRGSASPVASNVLVRWVRPWVETIVPSGTKMLETRIASVSRPPPFPRRSSTSPCAPCE